ncbi:MAG: D-alanyl-D-alanine carboxypeptidase family protein [Bacteroidetes bacterium]|nr:D-alanyl-D-alanine carboxypeptidase family protein [Bacteroidota bacterium]
MRYLLLLLFLPNLFACTQQGKAQPEQVNLQGGSTKLPKEKYQKTVADSVKPVAVKDTPAQPKPKPEFSVEYIMGKFDPAQHPDFVPVDKKYADGEGYYLRKETYASFVKMHNAALADGITLSIISATRNFAKQKSIWEAKWTGARKIENGANAAKKYPDAKNRALKILEYSSMPGSSRHHWGTDIDLNDLDNYTFEQGPGKKVYDWMVKHAHEYGFCQPYSKKSEDGRNTGYNEEKWHWSYMPIAKKLTDLAARTMTDDMIGGFKGAETAVKIGIVEKYVLGVNPDCL